VDVYSIMVDNPGDIVVHLSGHLIRPCPPTVKSCIQRPAEAILLVFPATSKYLWWSPYASFIELY